MSQTTIQTFPQLIDWLHENDVTPDQIHEIVRATIGVFFVTTGSKEDLLKHLVNFWSTYSHLQEVPLFIKPTI